MAQKNQRQLCTFFVIYIWMYLILKKSGRNFEIKREYRHLQLRRIWCAIITKVKMVSKLKKRGDFDERQRSAIKQSVAFWFTTLKRPNCKRMVQVMYLFLYDRNKKNQLMIKIENTLNRIYQLQNKFRLTMLQKRKRIQLTRDTLEDGLVKLREILIYEKEYQGKYKETISIINAITQNHKGIIEEAARLYLLLPAYIHSVNLVRWYSKYRNEGQWNKDTYVVSYNQIYEITQKIQKLMKKRAKWSPHRDAFVEFLEIRHVTEKNISIYQEIQQAASKLLKKVNEEDKIETT